MLGVVPDPKTSPTEAPSGLRADAERNRARIVDAAGRLYATHGLGISMAAVARAAGVGKATLARHFATPQDLIDAVFVDRMETYAAVTREALEVADPWEAFVGYIWAVCRMQAEDRGFADLLTMTLPAAAQLEELRETSYLGFLELITNAKASGHLRPDFESEDLIVLLMANAGVVSAAAAEAPRAWERLVGQVLRGYASPEASTTVTMPPAPSSEELVKAMARTIAPNRL